MTEEEFNSLFGAMSEATDEELEEAVASLESLWPAIVGHISAIVQWLKQWFSADPKPGTIAAWFQQWWNTTLGGIPPWTAPSGGA